MDPRAVLETWRSQRALDDAGYRWALQQLGILPDLARWRGQIERLLLVCGMLCVAVGAISLLTAFDWHAWPRLAVLGLVQAIWLALLAVAWLSWGRRPESRSARWGLFAIAVMAGLWLGVVDTAYPSGMDGWQFLLLWAALALPWAVLARWMPLWVFWGLLMAWALKELPGQLRMPGGVLVEPYAWVNLPMLAFLLLSQGVVEWLLRGRQQWAQRILPRLLGALLAVMLTFGLCMAILEAPSIGTDHFISGVAVGVLWLIWAAASLFAYYRRQELFLLALPLFAAWAVGITLACKAGRLELILSLLAVLAVFGLSAISWWLNRLNRRWSANPVSTAGAAMMTPETQEQR
ncbi:hypothetical protein IGB42_00523 [Andreprevotia sp. IGB-42]|uniref:DUF2157 domain-containing protein n=1 Tax=Andreprevotia sp. IGB-42 TaxID=2497473 RepID=UPI0013584764|nr:DUF2157 domain-containing protein [Andreprevotia sp. IGB-42]KAF0815442.1 hypothetical protein IGB42_00523 [Andreprevotia sp. IGB-42]